MSDMPKMKWFGDSWGAPINMNCEHAPTPEGVLCEHCMLPIEVSDKGFILPLISSDKVEELPYHHYCFVHDVLGL